MTDKQYPKEKYGSETELEVNTETGKSVALRDDVYNGGVTRKLILTEDSLQIDDEKAIVERVFDLYRQKKEGNILGFSVDAGKYHPQTFKVSRIVFSTIKLA
jgi:hypothetical protein